MAILASTILTTKFGPFKVNYHKNKKYQCISFSYGNLTKGVPIVRLHSACLFGELFKSLHCDCGEHIPKAMKIIQKHGNGIIIYSYQEGRGIGLLKKIKAMEIQRTKNCDTVEAFKLLGFKKSDYRDYKVEIGALKNLMVSKNIITFAGNPHKISSLKKAGYQIKKLIKPYRGHLSKLARDEIRTKKQKMGYIY